MLLSWLVLSNHCALGDLAKDSRTHAGCCGNKAAEDEGKSPGHQTRECCKTLHALAQPLPAKFSKPAAVALLFVAAWNLAEQRCQGELSRRAEFLETGPPRARSFAEMVLQRSLPVHAPPFTA
jgi:hypothetical protein